MSKVINKNDIILTHIILDGKPYDGKLSRTVWIGGKSNINSCTYDEYVDFNLWMRGLKSRQDYFADYISEKLPVEKYRKLLEVGCGKNPRVSKVLAEKGYQMTSMDMVINCKKRPWFS